MNEEDLVKYKAMKSVIMNGKFEIKGDAVTTVASLFHWFYEMENKIKVASMKKATDDVTIKEIK